MSEITQASADAEILHPSKTEVIEQKIKVEVLKVVDAIDDFVGTHVVAPVEAVAEKVETTVETVLEEIKQEVLTEVRNVEEVSKEGYVAAENIARKILNHHIAAGGGSVIKNPA